jgi:Amt family ammonium transporter
MAASEGTIAWLLCSTALVMLMTPGVGFFYGGLVRKKNFISMVSLSFITFALVTIQWVVIGYTLAFGGTAPVIGNLDFAGLSNVSFDSGTFAYPPLLFMIFQLTFAAVTMAIVTSGMAERIKLSAFLIFALFWVTFVYSTVAHWVWGGGWLQSMGFVDFAGGAVVHITAGFAALALALVIGKRSGFGEYSMDPHNIPMTLLGAALLWFGWFGFNGGSALAANGLAVHAIVVTNISAATGALTWLFISWGRGMPSSVGMVSGVVAGLGAVTPACGYVTPMSGMVIGAVASGLCYYAMLWRIRKRMDESLDAWAVHGVGGLWGTIAVGIFAVASINGASGLIEGNTDLLVTQVIGAVTVMVFAFAVTFVLAWVINRLIGLRVSEEAEYVGLDLSQHGERAY